VVAEKSAPTRVIDSRRASASRVLGVPEDADLEAIKRAYRKLARDLHPDLQPAADNDRRRALERRFAEVTAAYEALL
jgi:molecular chaperone DnaJ